MNSPHRSGAVPVIVRGLPAAPAVLAVLALLALRAPGAAAAAPGWLGGLSDGVRVRSMGGCFAALGSPVDAALFNPAGLAARVHHRGMAVELGPLAPLGLSPARSDGDWPWEKALPAVAALRRLEWRGRRFALALYPADWQPAATTSLPAWGDVARPASAEVVPLLAGALALDARVRLGMAMGAWYDDSRRERRPGVSYGVIIRANRRMDVGGQAAYLPVGALDARRPLDQLGDGTINVGVAWYPLGRGEERQDGCPLLLALDVRNVTQESGLSGAQELHLGAEAGPGRLKVRAGVFWPNTSAWTQGRPCAGAGLGWRDRLRRGALRLDLGLTADPADTSRLLVMTSLGWQP